jgi:hypothetical protein
MDTQKYRQRLIERMAAAQEAELDDVKPVAKAYSKGRQEGLKEALELLEQAEKGTA